MNSPSTDRLAGREFSIALPGFHKSLTATLRHLERDGPITRTVTPGVYSRELRGNNARARYAPEGSSSLGLHRQQSHAFRLSPHRL